MVDPQKKISLNPRYTEIGGLHNSPTYVSNGGSRLAILDQFYHTSE